MCQEEFVIEILILNCAWYFGLLILVQNIFRYGVGTEI